MLRTFQDTSEQSIAKSNIFLTKKMACCQCSYVVKRYISNTSVLWGKRNFRKFLLHNKRGTRQFKEKQATDPYPDIPVYHYGVRPTGYYVGPQFFQVPEMVPELVVPDLNNFKLKPYVSYRVPDVVQSEFTAQDLFNVVYAPKITEDFKNNKLDDTGNPLEPSPEENLTSEEAFLRARQTGCDLFYEESPVKKE